MNKFKLDFNYIYGNKKVKILKLIGILDEQAFAQWGRVIKKNIAEEGYKLVINCTELKEVSASGLFFLTGWLEYLLDKFETVKIVGLANKLKNKLYTVKSYLPDIFSGEDESATIARLFPIKTQKPLNFILTTAKQEIISGEPFTVKLEVLDNSKKPIPHYKDIVHLATDKGVVSPIAIKNYNKKKWSGDIVLVGQGKTKLRLWNEFGWGEIDLLLKEKGEEKKFPIEIKCPSCYKNISITRPDIFRCTKCSEIYFVDKYAHVVSLGMDNKYKNSIIKRIKFAIPSDINYLNYVRDFMVGIASEEGFDEVGISHIEMALDEALANVIEHAYLYDTNQQINIEITIDSKKLVIILKDQGRSFNIKKNPLPNLKQHISKREVGGLGRYVITSFMDEVKYTSYSWGNELRMVKKF